MAGFLFIVILGVLLLVLVALIRFCVKDARRRGKSGFLVVLAVVFFFPLGLIAWLLFRPPPLDAGPAR